MTDWDDKHAILTIEAEELQPCLAADQRKREVQVKRYDPVHHAAACGNTDFLEFLLNQQSVNSRDPGNSTPLHLAARYLQLECVKLLLDQEDIEVDALDGRGLTPLHSAGMDASINVDDVEEEPGSSLYLRRPGSALPVVELLMERGANPHQDNGKNTFVDIAVARHDTQLLKYTWDIPRLRGEYGMNILGSISIDNDLDFLQTLLSSKDSVKDLLNEPLPNGFRLLLEVALDGWVEGVKELLQAGAKITDDSKGSYNVLHCAAVGGSPEVIEMILKEAMRKGNIFEIINAPCTTGETPLFIAVSSRNRKCVHHFLNWGADVNWKADGNYNLIHQASLKTTDGEGTSSDMLRYLLEYPDLKSFVNEVTTKRPCGGDFGTPVNIAAWSGDLDCVKVLVEDYKADVKKPFDSDCAIDDIQGRNWTPLHSAAYKGHLDITKYIVDRDSTTLINVTVDGWTPLHVAAWNTQEERVKLLLKLGASLTETTGSQDQKEKGTSALKMILDKHLYPQNLLVDIFDSCIIDSEDTGNSHIEINYGPVMPHGDKISFDVLMTLANCGEKYYEKIEKDELILHPLLETSVYLKAQEMIRTVLMICSIHSLFVLGFYFLTSSWQDSQSTPFIDITGLILIFAWFRFSLDKELVTEDWRQLFGWRTWPLFLCLLMAMVMTVSHLTSLGGLSDYSTLVLVPMVLVVTLRVLYYFNPAALTTIVIMVQVFVKYMAVAGVVAAFFMVVFMLKPSTDDPFNDFGKMMISQLELAIHCVAKEVQVYSGMNVVGIVKRLFVVVPLMATYILRINPYTGYLTKFIKSKARQGHVESIIEQANFLERVKLFWFQTCQDKANDKCRKCPKLTRGVMTKVYHTKNLDSKFHGSVLLGNRVWECVADWYINQEDPARKKDKDLFSQAKGIKQPDDSSCSCTKEKND